MARLLQSVLAGICLACLLPGISHGEEKKEKDQDRLQGVWVAQSMEADGKPAPEDAVKRMRFTFDGEKLKIRGNHADDTEATCPFKIDDSKSPRQLDFTIDEEPKPILGIYKFDGEELKVCIRHASSSEGRPEEFKTTRDSQLVLIVFKKEKKEKK
jgi:uncharacterized protein (TIGR03067 family)